MLRKKKYDRAAGQPERIEPGAYAASLLPELSRGQYALLILPIGEKRNER